MDFLYMMGFSGVIMQVQAGALELTDATAQQFPDVPGLHAILDCTNTQCAALLPTINSKTTVTTATVTTATSTETKPITTTTQTQTETTTVAEATATTTTATTLAPETYSIQIQVTAMTDDEVDAARLVVLQELLASVTDAATSAGTFLGVTETTVEAGSHVGQSREAMPHAGGDTETLGTTNMPMTSAKNPYTLTIGVGLSVKGLKADASTIQSAERALEELVHNTVASPLAAMSARNVSVEAVITADSGRRQRRQTDEAEAAAVQACVMDSCLMTIMGCMATPACQGVLVAVQGGTMAMEDITREQFQDTPELQAITDCTNTQCGHLLPATFNTTSSTQNSFSSVLEKWKNAGQGDITLWDTSMATDMSNAFRDFKMFNEPLNAWQTSSVTTMQTMFADAKAFNQPIGDWQTSSVTTMENMFYEANAFNQPIGGWQTSNVTTMGGMFAYTKVFNQPIGGWQTSNVATMFSMFSYARAFNQPIGDWQTSSVTTMRDMFTNAQAFNQPIGDWQTSNVTTMQNMFRFTEAFNQPIGGWQTSNVTTMESVFWSASAFNQPIGGWQTSSVTTMKFMFYGANAFNQPIGGWQTSNVAIMQNMFRSASAFNQPIGDWQTSSVTTMKNMFDGAIGLSSCHKRAMADSPTWRMNTAFQKEYSTTWQALKSCVPFHLALRTPSERTHSASSGGYHDYDDARPYYVGTPYKIAPLRTNATATTVSEGSVGDIRYVMPRQNASATQFFINPYSGVAFGEFPAPGNVSLTIIGVDAAGLRDTLEVYTFNVQMPPVFRIAIRTHVARTTSGGQDLTDYDSFGGPYYLGYDYKIAPKPIDDAQTVFSDNQARTITYRLNQTNATAFFVNSATGVIYGKFDAKLDPGNYTVGLVAAEESGQTDTLETYTFRVLAPPAFRVKTLKGVPRVFTGQGFHDYGNGGGLYYLGSDYKIAPRPVDLERTIFSNGNVSDITYRLNQTNSTDFFVNSDTGVIYGKFDAATMEPGNYAIGLLAVDKGGQTDTLETYIFDVHAPTRFGIRPSSGWNSTTLNAGDGYRDLFSVNSSYDFVPFNTETYPPSKLYDGYSVRLFWPSARHYDHWSRDTLWLPAQQSPPFCFAEHTFDRYSTSSAAKCMHGAHPVLHG